MHTVSYTSLPTYTKSTMLVAIVFIGGVIYEEVDSFVRTEGVPLILHQKVPFMPRRSNKIAGDGAYNVAVDGEATHLLRCCGGGSAIISTHHDEAIVANELEFQTVALLELVHVAKVPEAGQEGYLRIVTQADDIDVHPHFPIRVTSMETQVDDAVELVSMGLNEPSRNRLHRNHIQEWSESYSRRSEQERPPEAPTRCSSAKRFADKARLDTEKSREIGSRSRDF